MLRRTYFLLLSPRDDRGQRLAWGMVVEQAARELRLELLVRAAQRIDLEAASHIAVQVVFQRQPDSAAHLQSCVGHGPVGSPGGGFGGKCGKLAAMYPALAEQCAGGFQTRRCIGE